MIKVSVIIPVYNTEKYLEACLECIVNQTLREIEIICINDGSTDGSGSILEKYADSYHNLVVINQENAGQSAARNAGLRIAKGKYIYCMDSDDILLRTALEELWELSESDNLDVVYFSAATYYENSDLSKKRTDFQDRYIRKGSYPSVLNGKELLVTLYQNRDYIVSTCLQFIRRQYLTDNDIHFYEGIIHEDNLFCFNVLMNAKRCRCLNEIYFYRRVRASSVMTKAETSKNLKGYYTCLIEQIRTASDLSYTDEEFLTVEKVFSGLMYHVRRIWGNLPSSERKNFIDSLNIENKILFSGLFLTNISEINRMSQKVSSLEKRLNESEEKRKKEELTAQEWERKYIYLQNSFFCKLEQTFTRLLHKLRTGKRVFKNDGVQGIVQLLLYKLQNRGEK